LVALVLLANGWAPEISGDGKAMAIAILAVLLIAPVGLHFIGTSRSEDELDDLLGFLSEHSEADP
jgi:multisubunit Na+/H+ antiporter MnhG subunit